MKGEENMGRIMLATSASTDEEYGGTIEPEDTGWVKLSQDYEVYYRRIGKLVEVYSNIQAEVGNMELGTLPSGCRPPATMLAPDAFGTEDRRLLTVRQNGTVAISNSTAVGWVVANMMYFAN